MEAGGNCERLLQTAPYKMTARTDHASYFSLLHALNATLMNATVVLRHTLTHRHFLPHIVSLIKKNDTKHNFQVYAVQAYSNNVHHGL